MENGIRSLMRVFLGVLLVSPVFAILAFSSHWKWPDSTVLFDVLLFTLGQAAASAVVALFFGTLGALGLLAFRARPWYQVLEMLCLVPGFLPPLLVILPVFQVSSWFGHFPLGWNGIVLVHSLMCIGLVSVAIARLIHNKMGGMIELAWVEGASRWQLLRHGLMGTLREDFFLLGFYLLTLCFASFAVPLVMGGLGGLTIEVLIFEKIRQGGAWSEAFVLAMVQVLFLLGFSLVLKRETLISLRGRSEVSFLSWPWGILVPSGVTLLVVGAQFGGMATGLRQLFASPELVSVLPVLIGNSLLVGLGTGLTTFLLLSLIAALSPHWGLDRFLIGYASPSSVITAFAFLLLGFYGYWGSHLAMIFGLTLLSLPSLYRMAGRSLIVNLSRQVQVARVAGAGWNLVFWAIVFPQVRSGLLWLSGLAAFWACGDFALSSIVAESNSTLALLVKAYLTSYQLELATVLNVILILVSAVCFLVFGGWAHVTHQKSHS